MLGQAIKSVNNYNKQDMVLKVYTPSVQVTSLRLPYLIYGKRANYSTGTGEMRQVSGR